MRFLAALILAIGLPALAQDLTITSKVTRDGGAPETTTSYLSSDHARMASANGNEVIVDFKSGTMTTLDAKRKTYSVITREELDAMAAKVKERMNSPEMKKAQEQMKNLPPEAQERMKAMMGSMFTVNVEKIGTHRTIAGYPCENWMITMGQMTKTEECLTNDLKLPLKSWEMYRGYSDMMKNMMAAMGPMARNFDAMMEQMKKAKGFPLATTTSVEVMGRKSTSTSEVTSIKEGRIPAAAWEIPAGYKKVESPIANAMRSK